MREIGTIVGIEDGFARIQIKRHTACGNCGACQVGQEKLVMETSAINSLSAKIGDQVEIETETTNILKASFIIYTFPLLFFIMGTFIGYTISNFTAFKVWNNIIGFAVGILFMVLSYLIIKSRESKIARDNAFKPKMCRIVYNNNLPHIKTES